MIEEAPKNKMEIAPKRKDEPEKVTIRAVSRIKNEYHFPGSGIWEPLAVVASTIEEATHIWKERRVPVAKPEEPPAEEKKTEAPQEPVNEETSHTEAKVEEPKTNNE